MDGGPVSGWVFLLEAKVVACHVSFSVRLILLFYLLPLNCPSLLLGFLVFLRGLHVFDENMVVNMIHLHRIPYLRV